MHLLNHWWEVDMLDSVLLCYWDLVILLDQILDRLAWHRKLQRCYRILHLMIQRVRQLKQVVVILWAEHHIKSLSMKEHNGFQIVVLSDPPKENPLPPEAPKAGVEEAFCDPKRPPPVPVLAGAPNAGVEFAVLPKPPKCHFSPEFVSKSWSRMEGMDVRLMSVDCWLDKKHSRKQGGGNGRTTTEETTRLLLWLLLSESRSRS